MGLKFWPFTSAREPVGDGGELNRKDAQCPMCRGTGECFTCGSTGVLYAGTFKEETCRCCRGTGRCPDCGNDLLV